MRRFVYALTAGALAVVIAAPAFAQSSDSSRMASSGSVTVGNTTIEAGGAGNADLNVARYKAWDEFRSANPGIVRELRHNPKMAGNAGFVDRHPELKQLFDANAGMQEDMERNPGNYMAGAKYSKYSMMSSHHRHHHKAASKTSA
jgi:hypothetical protein